MKTLLKEKPTKIKGNFILSAYLSSTMGVSHRLKLKG
jgi:ribosomal protein L1